MIKKYFIIFSVLIMTASCDLLGKKGMSPLQYNEFVSKLETALKPEINKAEARIAEFNGNEQYDSIRLTGLRMKKMIQADIDTIQNTPAPKGKEAEAFKLGSIRYFQYIRDAYAIYEEYGAAATQEKRDEALNKLREKMSHKEEESSSIHAVQLAFAQKSGFKVR